MIFVQMDLGFPQDLHNTRDLQEVHEFTWAHENARKSGEEDNWNFLVASLN